MLFFPKLLAGPILKYHEMKDQIAKPPAVEWSDFVRGFLRFARITYDIAGRLYGANKDEQKAVKDGWKAVGIAV